MIKFRYILFVVVSLILLGCKKELDQPIYGIQTESNYYKNIDQLSEALNAAYYSMRRNGQLFNYGEFSTHFLLQDATTDDANVDGINGWRDWNLLQAFSARPENQVLLLNWEARYKSIFQANLVISRAAGVPGDENLIKRIVNEAKFVRAFNYYSLATWYGDVPLIVEPQKATDVFVSRDSRDKVFEQIVADLTDATSLPLKSEYPLSDLGRVTSGAAYAMLGKVYLFLNKFEEAENALAKVVLSNEYSLVPDYGQLFTQENNNGPESVFEIQYVSDPNGQQNGGTALVQWFGNRNTGQGFGFHNPTQDLRNAFDDDDPRISYTFYQTGDRFAGNSTVEDVGSTTSSTGYLDRKIYIPPKDQQSVIYDIGYNAHIIRYADVLLLYAEALNENGKPLEALTRLEQIRYRARHSDPHDMKKDIQVYIPPTNPATSLPPVTTTDQGMLREAIWRERRVELGMEGWRRDDLLRQKRFGQVMRAYADTYGTGSFKGGNFDDARDYLMPIPQEEINRNKSLTQNPGY